jgi:hypothetical protein
VVTYTVAGMKPDSAQTVIGLLQDRLNALNDLALTLKHVHWNAVGPTPSRTSTTTAMPTPSEMHAPYAACWAPDGCRR